jgi:hypothetical protein
MIHTMFLLSLKNSAFCFWMRFTILEGVKTFNYHERVLEHSPRFRSSLINVILTEQLNR